MGDAPSGPCDCIFCRGAGEQYSRFPFPVRFRCGDALVFWAWMTSRAPRRFQVALAPGQGTTFSDHEQMARAVAKLWGRDVPPGAKVTMETPAGLTLAHVVKLAPMTARDVVSMDVGDSCKCRQRNMPAPLPAPAVARRRHRTTGDGGSGRQKRRQNAAAPPPSDDDVAHDEPPYTLHIPPAARADV